MSEATGQEQSLAARMAGVVVAVRAELRVTRTIFQERPYYVVRDPITFQSFRLPADEYAIFVALQDERPLKDVFEGLVESGAMTNGEEESFYRFVLNLHQMGLLNLPIPDHEMLYERFESKQRMNRKRKLLGFLFMQVPLAAPDAFLDQTVRWVRPLFTRAAFVAWCVLMLVVAALVTARWSDLTAPLLTLLELGNLPWLAGLLVVLKVFHELGHAFACKVFGGRVPEMGAIFIVGTPCAYVDASAAWGFASKLQRIIVSLAGMYVEVTIGAFALMAWALTGPSFLNSLAYQAFMMSTVVTVLFNINPLMRYDGYYVLSDLVEIPNLRARSQARTVAWLKWAALGFDRPAPEATRWRGGFLTAFGFASAVYKVTLVVGICALIATKAYFLGLALCAFYLSTTLGGTGLKLGRYLLRAEETQHVRGRAQIVAVLLALLPVLFVVLPVSIHARPIGVVTAEQERVVRARTAGFLEQVDVRVGEEVDARARIARLTNAEARERVAEARAELEILELEIHQGAVLDRRAAHQKERRRSYFEGVLGDALDSLGGLDVDSAEPGRVLRLDCEGQRGAFFEEGAPLALIGRGPWVGKFLVDESTFTYCDIDVGARVQCRSSADPRDVFEGIVLSIAPSAQREVEQQALTQLGGGAIVVDPETGRAERAFFEIVLAFDEDDRARLRHGLRVVADLNTAPMPLAKHLYVRILAFLDNVRLG